MVEMSAAANPYLQSPGERERGALSMICCVWLIDQVKGYYR